MTPGALLLTPGAGSTAEHPSLVAIAEAVAPLPVDRHDFPYRRAGRRAPDRAPVLLADLREAAAALVARARVHPARLVLGGRSMGGRMCSMAVAEGLPAAGLVLVCYPLHPPGRPDQLRTAHLPALEVPCLFVSGTRDPFGTPDELTAATAAIPGPVTHAWVEGGRHDLRGADAFVARTVADWLARLRSGGRAPSRPRG
ncbi:MAG: alpha/beta family hydrolase [Acidimicrobiia bacterium]